MRLARPVLLLLVALALTLAVALVVVRGRDPAVLGPLPADPFAGSVDPVLVGAGDIADCRLEADSRTADLLDVIGGTVFTAGDNAYPSGSLSEYERCYGPTWGRHRARTRPAVGNHEYLTEAGSGYRAYWGDAAGARGEFWYSFDLGAWHVIVLEFELHDHRLRPGLAPARVAAGRPRREPRALHGGHLAPPTVHLRRARRRHGRRTSLG